MDAFPGYNNTSYYKPHILGDGCFHDDSESDITLLWFNRAKRSAQQSCSFNPLCRCLDRESEKR